MSPTDPYWRPRPPGRQFDDTRRAHPDWPCVLAEGDSWFAHPIQWNILFHLSAMGGYAIRRLASIGDELRDMVRRRAEVARGWRGLIRDDAADAALEAVRRAWLRVIFRTQQIRPGLPILAHGYDYPFPRPKGTPLFWGRLTFKGPWIHPVLHGEKGITDPDERYAIVAELVDRLNRMLARLAAEHPTFHHVDLRGTLPSPRQWDDEIHPRSAGFRAMAKTFADAMARALH